MEDVEDSFVTTDILVEEIGFHNRTIMIVCGFIFFLDVLINLDHGALPAAANAIKEQTKMPNVQIGSLGSMVFLGLVCGSICGAVVLGRLKFKTVLVISFLGNGLGLLLFTVPSNIYVMGFARFLSGFAQIFLTIYIPLYCDCFGSATTKPVMLSLILLAAPIGVVSGYLTTGLLISHGVNWTHSFFFQGVTMLVMAAIICFFPARFINLDDCIDQKRDLKMQKNRQLYLSRRNPNGDMDCLEMNAIHEAVADENQSTSKDLSLTIEEPQPVETAERSPQADPPAQSESIKALLTNVPYMCCILSISIYFFVISGLQYWISDYFVEVIGATVS